MADDTTQDEESRADYDADSLPRVHERSLLRHLPYFATVAEEGHFHRAATRLNITQPALSRRVQALEQEMGVALFTRSQRSVRLTAAGEIFHRDVNRIMGEVARAIGRAKAVTRGNEGHLKIGLNHRSMHCERVTEGFRRFRTAFPGVALNFTSLLSEAQLVALKREEIDAGFLAGVAVDEASRATLDLLRIADFPFALALHKDHPLATRERLRIADLHDAPLTWPSRSSGRGLSDEMIAAFRAVGMSPNIVLEVPTTEATFSFASAGLGMGFVIETAHVPSNVVIRPVDDFNVVFSLNLAWARENQQPALMHFVDLMRGQSEESESSCRTPV